MESLANFRLGRQQVDQFERDGFLDGGSVIADEELEELRSELTRVIEQSHSGFTGSSGAPVTVRNLGNGPRPIVQVINIWQASGPFRRLVFHPAIVSAISQLARSPDLILFHDQVVFKPPMDGGIVQWHQDAPYWKVIEPTTPVSAWVALDDVDDDNGAMWMVPGSHRWGDASAYLRNLGTNELKDPRELGFDVPADAPLRSLEPRLRKLNRGEVAYHHAMTWHGSGPNRCTRPRRAIAIHYVVGHARFRASAFHEARHLIQAGDGESMSKAGPAFPYVCRDGVPVSAG